MYVDEIEYTLNHVKLILILSIHKNETCILENQKPVKPKPKLLTSVCVNLSISKLIIFTQGLNSKTKQT